MATTIYKNILIFHLFIFINLIVCDISNFSVYDKCQQICTSKYELTKENFAVACKRGCRLYSIIDYVKIPGNNEFSKSACMFACDEAYAETSERNSCYVGCEKQKEIAKRWGITSRNEDSIHSFYPLRCLHNIYSNMFNDLSSKISITLVYFSLSEDGQEAIIIQTQPDKNFNYQPSVDLETNIAEVDRSATHDIKLSQILGYEETKTLPNFNNNKHTSIFGCLAKRTGISRLLLSLTLLFSVVFMIWLCFNSAATAPEKKDQVKLSVNGDLDYLKSLDPYCSEKIMIEKYPSVFTYCEKVKKENI